MNAMKTNHMTNKIKSLAAALALALFALAGCQQTADGGDSQQALVVTQEAGGSSLGGASSGSAAWITLSLGGQNDLVSKTTLPSADDAVWKSFELVGTATTAGDLTNISYSTPAQCDDPVADLQAAKIPARYGAVYNLTLTAVTTGGAVYSAKATSSSIDEGDNLVAFDLKISALGSAGAQEGRAQIAVNLPANVTRLTVVVYKVDASGTPQSSPISPEQRLEIVAQKADFDSGSLEPGPYLAKFTLWGGAQGDSVIGNWEEYFGIAGGMVSRGTLGKIDGSADDDRADEAYSITYHLNDSTEVPATVTARTSYSRNTLVDQEYVKSLSSRAGYRMMGWYTDEQLTQAFASTSGMEAPLDLYAKWSAELYISLPDRYAHGSAAAQPKPAIAGEQVDITPTPDDGWTPGKITITAVDKDGQPLGEQPIVIDVIPPDTTAKSFTMPTLSYGQGVKVDVDFLATVTFDLNKPVDAAADDTAAASGSTGPQYFVINESQALNANGFAIVGWTFTGWNTAADASGTPYAAGADFTTDAPITLYAQWTPNTDTQYKVCYRQQKTDLSGYDIVTADTLTTAGTTWTDTATPPSKTYTGFTKKDGPAPQKIKANGSTVINVDYDRISYDITKTAGSNGSLTAKINDKGSDVSTARYGQSVTITITPKTDYTLDTFKYNGTVKTVTNNKFTFTMPASAVTVSATFKDDLFRASKNDTVMGDIALAKGNDTKYAPYDKYKSKKSKYSGWTPVGVVVASGSTRFMVGLVEVYTTWSISKGDWQTSYGNTAYSVRNQYTTPVYTGTKVSNGWSLPKIDQLGLMDINNGYTALENSFAECNGGEFGTNRYWSSEVDPGYTWEAVWTWQLSLNDSTAKRSQSGGDNWLYARVVHELP